MNYYNEWDLDAAAWLQGLMDEKLIPYGHIDTRSITEVRATDLAGYDQCHFFAGIGGWCEAFRLAGWPVTRRVWSASCPCQPYSVAGKGQGEEDARDLWDDVFRLARECRPDVIFGEQVENAIGHGWLDRIRTDLEREGYACGSAVLGAHSIGAPHIRQRLYWMAYASRGEWPAGSGGREPETRPEFQDGAHADGCSAQRGLADTESGRLRVNRCAPGQAGHFDERVRASGLAHASNNSGQSRESRTTERTIPEGDGSRIAGGMVQPLRPGLEGHAGDGCDGDESGWLSAGATGSIAPSGHWAASRWIECRDGKFRRIPIEPALFPLADGLPYRVARRRSARAALLAGAGNAIVTPCAAEFIKAGAEYLSRLTV